MAGWTRRAALLGTGAVLGYAGARFVAPKLPTQDGTASLIAQPREGFLNDASGLSPTPVHRHFIMPERGPELVEQLRAELREAAAGGRAVNVGAARHSMGAQAIPRNGHAVTFNNGALEPDTENGTYRVHAGARWSQVIGALDPVGLGPKVMQSNNDFGVAATFCVNAHGWPVPHGPMGATVRWFNMVLADGELVTCSPTENADLFNLTMGGYGLTGLITEMEVEAAANKRLEPTFEEMPGEEFSAAFLAVLEDPEVDMAYGRLNVDRARFFADALLISYRAAEDQTDLPPVESSGWLSKVSRPIFRAQLGNEPVKRWRWGVETGLGPKVGGGAVTRNNLINEPVATLDDRDPARTDILHEYFVAPDRFGEFLSICREVIPASYQEFLNITLRFVANDAQSVLSYAPVDRIAAVMLFSQEMTARAEADMARMTRALIDRVTAIGGTFYLPYRPHATVEQLTRAYPRAAEFAAAKRAIDPDLRFRNGLWENYLGAL